MLFSFFLLDNYFDIILIIIVSQRASSYVLESDKQLIPVNVSGAGNWVLKAEQFLETVIKGFHIFFSIIYLKTWSCHTYEWAIIRSCRIYM